MTAIWMFLFLSSFHAISSFTEPHDAAVLQSLKVQWKNMPPSWGKSNDPCGTSEDSSWEGVTCNSNSRVTKLHLSSMGVKGTMSGDIGGLSALETLDLSQNRELTGPLSASLGKLLNLNTLILAGCGFGGTIPDELGNLVKLTFLALNSNNLIGPIPASLGNLSNVSWLDLANNQLSGLLPVSSSTGPGLDLLLKAEHFHFNQNKLSGPIPAKLFSSEMILRHILFNGNELTGPIPSTLGLVQTLEVLRLDRNLLSGSVPANLTSLTKVNELHMADNKLSGPLPDLTGLVSLSYVDLSNNSFTQSEAPTWFTTAKSLTTLIIEYGPLEGFVPEKLFSLPLLQQVKLRNNSFNGTLYMGKSISQQLQLVDLENNNIELYTMGNAYKNDLILVGNPFCTSNSIKYCENVSISTTYSTNLTHCGTQNCPAEQKLNPGSCGCAYPYHGTLEFRAPQFRDLSNATMFQTLEKSLCEKLDLIIGSVSLQNISFSPDDSLLIRVELFPPTKNNSFSRSEILKRVSKLTSQTYKPPLEFGPYAFIASPYLFPENGGRSISIGMIVGIAIGCTILVLGLVALGVYAFREKKRAERATELSKPFASWAPSGKDAGGAPQLKGARWFSFDDLKRCTNNFSENNEIGAGGYGKVYRGMLPEGQVVAIKRAQQGSMQGGHEFRTEIELLSRVHHKNLVSLVGFCFEQGEQMLVYEYMPNGTLRESLSGKTGIHLDWKRRLLLALGSARGLAYLHDLADPPIIHRDIKTTNILLDENLIAKVADFGLSLLVNDTGKGHVSTQVKGTLGYLDPEYYMTQQLSEKSDVYSFGVVMLELITAMQPIVKGRYIVREVKSSMDNTDREYLGARDIIDPAIKNTAYFPGFAIFLKLALQCVEEAGDKRPTMSDVVKTIETILQDEGINSNLTSAASSGTDFVNARNGPPRHPYSNDAFDYSGYNLSGKVEPK